MKLGYVVERKIIGMSNKLFLSIILLFLITTNLFSKECNSQYIQNNKEFFYKMEKTKVFVNPTIRWVDKVVRQSDQYLECNLNNKFLFL